MKIKRIEIFAANLNEKKENVIHIRKLKQA